MKITHHKNGDIKTLVEEAPYHFGYEDAKFKPKAVNNEPVAWMSQGGDVSRSADYFEEMGFKDLIPLYTHPVKELTDEEIMSEWEESKDEVDFARAILRKAQEK